MTAPYHSEIWQEQQRDAAPACTVLRAGTCTAARLHVCSTCGRPIAVGERHQIQVLVLDGEFQVVRMHGFACWEAIGK